MPTLAYSPRSRSGQNWMTLKKPLVGVMAFPSYIEFGVHYALVHQHRSNPRPQEGRAIAEEVHQGAPHLIPNIPCVWSLSHEPFRDWSRQLEQPMREAPHSALRH